MKLYDHLPDRVAVAGKVYRIRPAWDRMIEAFDVLSSDWPDADKLDYVGWLLFYRRPKDTQAAVIAAMELLSKTGKRADDSPPVFDFEQDAEYIIAAFRQAYGIDLLKNRSGPRWKFWRRPLHWFEFLALLSGLPEDTRLHKIMAIRATPLPAATKYNREEVQRLVKQKAAFALKTTEEERERRFAAGLMKLYKTMLSMAKDGEADGGSREGNV